MKQGFVLWNSSYADPENRSRLNPSGGLRPALIEPPAPHDVPLSKRRQTKNRTFHLLFKPDILTCYQQLPHHVPSLLGEFLTLAGFPGRLDLLRSSDVRLRCFPLHFGARHLTLMPFV